MKKHNWIRLRPFKAVDYIIIAQKLTSKSDMSEFGMVSGSVHEMILWENPIESISLYKTETNVEVIWELRFLKCTIGDMEISFWEN